MRHSRMGRFLSSCAQQCFLILAFCGFDVLVRERSPYFLHLRCVQPCQIGDTTDNTQEQHCESLNCDLVVSLDWPVIV